MRLIPKAKPVRIRIKSGGVECKDLNDLRRSFNVGDLRKIEPKQLMKWLDQVDGGAVIAKKLEAKKSPSDLNYYQYFFNVSDGELYWVWKELSKKKGMEKSARILEQKLVADGDTKMLQEVLKGKSDEEVLDFVSKEANKDIVWYNGEYFLNIGKKLFMKSQDPNSVGFAIIEKLKEFGVDGSEAIIQEYSVIDIKDIETLFEGVCKGDYDDYDDAEEVINARFGEKASVLPKNIRELFHAVHLAVAKGYYSLAAKEIKINHSTIALPNNEMKRLSNERLFLYAMFRRRLNDNPGLCNQIQEYLYNERQYSFSSPFMHGVGPVSCANILPTDIVTKDGRWVMKGGCNYTVLNTDFAQPGVFKYFLSLYFRHFLEPQYHDGDLSNI